MTVGVGLILNEFSTAGLLDDTLVVFSSDNGIPFPNGRTNLYDSGIKEPFMISHPSDTSQWGKVRLDCCLNLNVSSAASNVTSCCNDVYFQRSRELVSLVDIAPTVLDWFGVQYPSYSLFNRQVKLTGRSLLPTLREKCPEQQSPSTSIFTSQSLHEITMSYPMRSIRTDHYKLIQNLAFRNPFPIDQDFYLSPTFQDMLNRTARQTKIPWFKTLDMYYNRAPFELYDITTDPHETNNLFEDEAYRFIFADLQTMLKTWQNVTHDPWICYPGGVLEDSGRYKAHPQCMPLYNGY